MTRRSWRAFRRIAGLQGQGFARRPACFSLRVPGRPGTGAPRAKAPCPPEALPEPLQQAPSFRSCPKAARGTGTCPSLPERQFVRHKRGAAIARRTGPGAGGDLHRIGRGQPVRDLQPRTARSDRLADRRRDRRRHPAQGRAGDHSLGPAGHQQDRPRGGRGQQPGPNGARCGRAAGHAAGAAVLAQDRRGPGGGDRRDLPPGGAGCLTGRRRPSCGVADRRGWPAKGGACFNINQCGDSIARGLSRVRSSSTGGFHGPDKRHPDP